MRFLPERRDPDGQGVSRPATRRRPTPRSSRRCRACCAAASRTRECCGRSSGTQGQSHASTDADSTPDDADARAPRARGILATRFPQGLRRAHRRLQPRADRRCGLASRRASSHAQAPREPARSSIRGSRSRADGSVTAYTGKCELGPGHATPRRSQLVAEELVRAARPRPARFSATRRSRPIRARRRAASRIRPTSTTRNLALAGATAREALVRLASARLGVPADQLVVADGVVSVAGRSVEARHATASSSAGRKFDLALEPQRAARKNPQRVEGARHVGAARRHAGARHRRSSSSSTTCACPACCTARSCGRRRSGATLVERRRELGRATCRASSRSSSGRTSSASSAEKPWQAMQAATQLKATWTPGHGAAQPARASTTTCGQQPTRDTLVVDSRRRRSRSCASAATVVQRHLPPSVPDARIDRHLVRGRRRAGRHAPRSGRRRRPPIRCAARRRCCSGCRPENVRVDLHAGLRLLRHQRRRHGVLRRGAAVAGGRAAGSRAALAQGRDGVGELRPRRTSSISGSALDAQRQHRRLGLRGVVADPRRAARLRHARQRRHRHAGRVPAGGVRAARAGAAAAGVQQRQQRGAVVRHRLRRAARAAAPARSRASAC